MSDSAGPVPSVFVIDDDAAARQSVCELVRSHGAATEDFASAEQFLAQFDPHRPGCVVLDLRMDGMSGLELQQRLRDTGSRIPIIVTTAYADVPSTVQAMRAGAITLLQKPCPGAELWQHIEEALRLDAQRRRRWTQRTQLDAQLTELTPQERQILDLIVAGELNKSIARRVGVSERTVERERARIMQKLEVKSLAQLVQRMALIEPGAEE